MVLIKGGKYWVGSNEVQGARPQKQVQLADYCLDKTEVTVGDYAACVQSGACSPAATTVSWSAPTHDGWSQTKVPVVAPASEKEVKFWSRFCNGAKDDKKDHPINCVDWLQAESFCAAFGKRLPSEDEWEVAARGPESRTYAWGGAEPSADKACWKRIDFDKMSGDGTCAVGNISGGNTSNGLVGMTGNVWEWTSTREWNQQRNAWLFVDRGGGWSNEDKTEMTTMYRSMNVPERRGSNVGFRCAR
jgi:formylglycine-generating enzyme required for sulfatase activity